MDSNSLTPVVGTTRVHPRRRHQSVTTDASEVDEQPVAFSAPLEENSEVRRRFADIYEQAYRIVYRSD